MPSPLETLQAVRLAIAGLAGITRPSSEQADGPPLATADRVRLTVRALLDGSGESLENLGSAIGIAKSQLSRRLSGQAGMGFDDCDKIAAHYGVPTPALFFGPFVAYQLLPADRRRPLTVAEKFLSQHLGLPLTDMVASSLPPDFQTSLREQPQAPASTPEPDKTTPLTEPAQALTAVSLPNEPDAPTGHVSTDSATPDGRRFDTTPDGHLLIAEPAACIGCGDPIRTRIQGHPCHLREACEAALPKVASSFTAPAATVNSVSPAPSVAPLDAPKAPQEQRAPQPVPATKAELLGMIQHRVEEEATRCRGDIDAMIAALTKKSIPDVMALWSRSRVGARYDATAHPPTLDILQKPSKDEPDQIWEARPNWRNGGLLLTSRSGPQRLVAQLDMNGAYLSAFKAHLPIGQLHHDTSGEYDPKHAGLYFVTPPDWKHSFLPNPLGNREQPGPLWITSSTLRLLLRISGPKFAIDGAPLCGKPVIHEAYTAHSSEQLLETLRTTLVTARQTAIENDDTVTLEYVKDMYAKFVSTMGESGTNRKLERPDWMHILRSQAFANLWLKGWKAHEAGLEIVAMKGTDELHVIGDWRSVFTEGRNVTDVKLKGEEMIGGE